MSKKMLHTWFDSNDKLGIPDSNFGRLNACFSPMNESLRSAKNRIFDHFKRKISPQDKRARNSCEIGCPGCVFRQRSVRANLRTNTCTQENATTKDAEGHDRVIDHL
jgi:hypothetical protein